MTHQLSLVDSMSQAEKDYHEQVARIRLLERIRVARLQDQLLRALPRHDEEARAVGRHRAARIRHDLDAYLDAG